MYNYDKLFSYVLLTITITITKTNNLLKNPWFLSKNMLKVTDDKWNITNQVYVPNIRASLKHFEQ